jgi:hypothetical protein
MKKNFTIMVIFLFIGHFLSPLYGADWAYPAAPR